MNSSAPVIRPARPSDRAAILATVRAAELLTDDGVREVAVELDASLGGSPRVGLWLVDVSAPGVAAVAFCAPERMTDGTWNLLMLAVDPDRQRQGRGTALVRAVEEFLRANGARLLVIETSGTPAFAAQRRFYARLGYREQGWIEEFFGADDAKVVYAKSLTGQQQAKPGASGIRTAMLTDLDRLTELAIAFYTEDGFTTPVDTLARNMRTLITSDHARVAVNIDPGDHVAVAFAVTTSGFGLENGLIAELEDLYVVPDFRRGGIGTALVEDADDWARARGCTQLDVVIAPNGRAVDHLHRYYARLGFADDGRRLRSRNLDRDRAGRDEASGADARARSSRRA